MSRFGSGEGGEKSTCKGPEAAGVEVGGGEVEALRVAGAGREWGVMTHEARGWEGGGEAGLTVLCLQLLGRPSRDLCRGVGGRVGALVCA